MTTISDHMTGAGSIGTSTTSTGATPPVVAISVLGRFEMVIGGRDVARAIGRRDATRLAKFLALAPNRRAHREQIVDALWPESSLDTVQNRLHKAAHYLRRATGLADSVVLSEATVALLPDTPVEVDVFAFERLAQHGLTNGDAGDIDRAIALYRGDLLPDDPYEEWVEYDRQRLRGRLRELLRTSGRFHRLIAIDPTDEDGHVGIMRSMLRSGDRSGVLRQYAQLNRVLNDELGVEPGPEARALRDLALNAPSPDPARLLPRPDVTFYRTAGRTRCSGLHRPIGRQSHAPH
jgi:DNA-binding SARP family transcriptional activator